MSLLIIFSRQIIMNNFTKDNASKAMSFDKKNIKRKHEEDRTFKNILAYKNLHEMKMILRINDDRIKKITKSIEKWFKEHSNNMIEKLKIIENNNKIISFLQHLNWKYDDMFDHQNQSKNFIEHTFKFFVRKYLFNQRRNRDARDQNESQNFTTMTNAFFRTHDMSIVFERKSRVSNENLILKTRFENTQISLFVCTIENIFKNKISHNVKLDIIQRIFLKRWREILKQNINLKMKFFIHWNYDDETQTIMTNKHFKTTLFMNQNRDQNIIQFWLKSINDEQNMFFTFSIMNNKLTWSKNKQNFVIDFNIRARECFDE
jgi:hypothetical protein